GAQIVELDRRERRPHDAERAMMDGLAHPADQSIATLGDDHLEPRRLAFVLDLFDDRGPRLPIVELDALAQLSKGLVVRMTADLHDVRLGDVMAWVKEPIRELAVRRHEEDAFGVIVEASDGAELVGLVLDEIP